jgi:hypothetical protein
MKSTKNQEWYTPAPYIEAARIVMGGGIDLDPASCLVANETVKASQYYDEAMNGLEQPWYGRVWLNPPYGKVNNKSTIALFVNKLVQEYEAGNVSQAIILTPADLDEKWMRPLWNYIICFADHKLWFNRPDQSKSSQFFGTAFTYLGPNETSFLNVFSQFGVVARRISPQS